MIKNVALVQKIVDQWTEESTHIETIIWLRIK